MVSPVRTAKVAPGAAIYGAGVPAGTFQSQPRMTFSIAPAGFHCSGKSTAAAGEFSVLLTDPGNPGRSVWYEFGASGVDLGYVCTFFPALAAIASPEGADCTRPVGEIVTQIPTGKPQLLAATVLDPPGVPLRTGEGASSGEALNVFVVSRDGLVQDAECSLPPVQRQIGVAALNYFVTQTIAARAGSATVAAIRAGIGKMAAGQTSGGAAPDAGCHAHVDASLEQEIANSAQRPIGIPADAIDLPGVAGQVSVSFVAGEVAVCDAGLTAVLNTPGGFDNGDLSLSAAIQGSTSHGPFVYSADSTRWTSVPGAPAGQQLVTRFDPGSVSASLDGKLSLAFNPATGGFEPSFDIAHISISAFKQEVTLVGPASPLLQVGLEPSLEIAAEITRQEVEAEVEAGESEGLPTGAIEVDVADQVGGDAVIGIDEAASEFYGVNISTQVSRAHLAVDLGINFRTVNKA